MSPSGVTSDPEREAELAAEKALLDRLRAGEDAAFEELLRALGGRMLAVARRIVSDEEAAEDVVQEAFLSAFKSLDRFEGNARLGTWLHRIVVNAALMRQRKLARTPETPIEDLMPRFQDDGHHLEPPSPWPNQPEKLLERDEMKSLVRESIQRLPENYRQVLVLRDLEELDTKATAELLGITPNAVKVRLHRAHLALRGLLDPHLQGEGAGA